MWNSTSNSSNFGWAGTPLKFLGQINLAGLKPEYPIPQYTHRYPESQVLEMDMIFDLKLLAKKLQFYPFSGLVFVVFLHTVPQEQL